MSSRLAGSPTTTVETDNPTEAASENGAPDAPIGIDTPSPGGIDADADGQLNARRDAPVGGQAVLEGVMMRGVSTWAIAVRKPPDDPDGSPLALGPISVESFPLVSWL
ncbi:MAG TPA: hypothetical protein VGF47_04215, partial [Solirubrobacteraceae bacterium]